MSRLIAAVVVIALVLAGCGADQDSGAPSQGPTTDDSVAAGDDAASTTTTQAKAEAQPEDDVEPIESDADAADKTTTTPPATSVPEASTGSVVEAARADLAERLSVVEGDIRLVAYNDVIWRDGSLGCPEPGMGYTQALVEGYRIVLDAGGEVYEYHGAGSNPPRFCADPQDPYEGAGNPDA